MILGNEVSLAAYKKGLLSRSQNTKTLNSGDASPAERAAMYLAEINRIRKSMKENV